MRWRDRRGDIRAVCHYLCLSCCVTANAGNFRSEWQIRYFCTSLNMVTSSEPSLQSKQTNINCTRASLRSSFNFKMKLCSAACSHLSDNFQSTLRHFQAALRLLLLEIYKSRRIKSSEKTNNKCVRYSYV